MAGMRNNIPNSVWMLFVPQTKVESGCLKHPVTQCRIKTIMINNLLILLIGAVVLFEIFEHVVIPLIGYVLSRRKRPISGAEAMIGKVAEVKLWHKTKGQVFVDGELWQAICKVSMVKGDKAIVREVDGLTLKVEPFDD